MSRKYRKDLDFKVDTVKQALYALMSNWSINEERRPNYVILTSEVLAYARMEHINGQTPLVEYFGRMWTIQGIEIAVLHNSDTKQQNFMELVK